MDRWGVLTPAATSQAQTCWEDGAGRALVPSHHLSHDCLQWGRQPPPGALQASVCLQSIRLVFGRELTTKEPTSQVLLKNGKSATSTVQRLASDSKV